MRNEQYALDDLQNVQEPVWDTDALVNEIVFEDYGKDAYPGNGDEANVRSNSGVLDFFTDVEEALEEFVHGDTTPKQKGPGIEPIPVMPTAAARWRATSIKVASAMSNPVLFESKYRRRVTFWNYGGALIYISAKGNQGAATPNYIRVPISGVAFDAPRTIETTAEIWAVSAGADSVLEILEEFDMES